MPGVPPVAPLTTKLATTSGRPDVGPTDPSSDDVPEASRQLRALALLSGSLTDPLTPKDAAEVVERQALAVLGASSAVVMTLGEFPPASGYHDPAGTETPAREMPPSASSPAPQILVLLHAIGLPADLAAALQQVGLHDEVPMAEVARTGDAVFLADEADLRRYPGWCDAILATGSRSAAAVPVWANGHLRGVLGFTWDSPQPFGQDQRAFVLTLGAMCAQAIMRGYLKAGEHKAREAAEHANRAKTQFLRTMSHELRTPLTAVVGYTELLEAEVVGPVTEVQRDHLARIRRSSDHLLSLIEELLGYAKIEAGEQVPRVQCVRAAGVLDEALDIVRGIADAKGVHIRTRMPGARTELHTDPLKLRQILVNLLTNAVKYTDRGTVSVSVSAVGVSGDAAIAFSIVDSGHGIADADLEHIFEPFWQVDQSLTRPSGGTGLGLAVARQLARMLGGDVIVAESALGVGSTFVATIPLEFAGTDVVTATAV